MFTSFLVTSPAWIQARMPPPLVMATTWSASTVRPPVFATDHSIASVIRSPRLVSMFRLPGARSPFSSTSERANTTSYSAFTASMISRATAATVSSTGASAPSGISLCSSMRLVALSMQI